MNRKLRMGMIGGGRGAFIGAVHRNAALMDGEIELVCGAFSSDPERSRESGRDLYLDPSRCYATYEDMIRQENLLPQEQRMDFVSIVTPNHVHIGPARLAMEAGFDVVLDKPMTFTYEEAKALAKVVKDTGRTFCLTHTYTGYPMVKQARALVRSGVLGRIRKVYVEYPQGWLSTYQEATGYKQAIWRTDPTQSGIAGCMGDIGTHAFNMAEYVSGLKTVKISSTLNVVVEGRKLDDDGAVILVFDNGATGVLTASQIAAGDENNIRVRVYGEKGSVQWEQEDANSLTVKWLDQPMQVYRAGGNIPYLSEAALANTRTPGGHPEGYLEAFANHYRNFVRTVRAKASGQQAREEWLDFPGVEDGLRGMAFIENVVKASASEKKWWDFQL